MSQEKIVPDSWFYSEFRNRLAVPLWVWWAGEQGRIVQPGARFKIEGDPRLTAFLPRSYSVVASMKKMIENGRIEFCSSPAVILDNQLPDGDSMALQSQGTSPVLAPLPDAETENTRQLPKYTPTVTYNDTDNVIVVLWLAASAVDGVFSQYDTYEVDITLPNGRKARSKTGADMQLNYIPKAGAGVYKFKVITTGLSKDIPAVTGEEVSVTIPA
jgi:hypothetical protein